MSLKRIIGFVIFLTIICTTMLVCTACEQKKELDYYIEKDNYIEVRGTISSVKYNEDKTALYLNFSQLEPKLDDNCFKIVGDNLAIVQNNGIDELIREGDQVLFVTAPRYFGDGYVMPIVAITVNEDVLLEFADGYDNWINWLRE